MKALRLIAVLTMLVTALTLLADDKKPLMYIDASNMRIINRGWDNTFEHYTRLPEYMKDSVRDNQWWLYTHSSGIGIRFASNSKSIGAQYNLRYNFHMQHMAMTGIKGTDLYTLNKKGKWEYVNTARPQEKNYVADSVQQKVYVENLDGEWHEYLLYLPLYDGVNWVKIGIDSTAQLSYPRVNNPRQGKKIVCYGTSIMQGGCASRTGMVSTSMIQRDMNIECVNLATSGEGKMDFYMARVMATIDDVACFVLDPIPNCTKLMCDTLTYDFVNILRQLRPDVPIIMVEGPMYPYAKHDSYFRQYLPEKNEAWRRNYLKLKKENPKNLYYLTCDMLTGKDEEGTVDGIHLTDLGFRSYADQLEKLLRKIIK